MSDSTRNTENGAIRTLWTPEPAATSDARASMDSFSATDTALLTEPPAPVAEPERIDLTAIREKLAAAKGPEGAALAGLATHAAPRHLHSHLVPAGRLRDKALELAYEPVHLACRPHSRQNG